MGDRFLYGDTKLIAMENIQILKKYFIDREK